MARCYAPLPWVPVCAHQDFVEGAATGFAVGHLVHGTPLPLLAGVFVCLVHPWMCINGVFMCNALRIDLFLPCSYLFNFQLASMPCHCPIPLLAYTIFTSAGSVPLFFRCLSQNGLPLPPFFV